MSSTSKQIPFLPGTSETAALINSHDWSRTPLGPPEQWPVSLRSLLGVVLNSASPMVLFWGEELTCFYNDAYRPTLGSDKHPAIGMRAADIFPEAWEFVGPILEGVRTTGQPVQYHDILIPVFRNGQMEDVYWTFSYSPAFGDDGTISGVFVHCIETTETVLIRKELKQNDSLFRALAEGTDILIAASDTSRDAIYFNHAWTKLTGRSQKELIAFGWAELLHPDDKEKFLNTYALACDNKTSFSGECRILSKDGEYRWLLITATPRFDDDSVFAGFLSSSIDITQRRVVEEQFNTSRDRLNSVVESAPFPIGVYIGREMRITLANQAIMDVWGKGNDIIGKTYYEVLPELEGQGIYATLDNVFTTGRPFHARNQRVDLVVGGVLQTFYFNYSFTPLFDTEGKVYGVMNTAADVTDLNIATRQLARSEESFRNLIMQAPVAMCLMAGPQHVVEVANDAIVKLWGKSPADVMDKPIFEGLPDAREQGLEELLDHVYTTGETFRASEMPVHLLRFGRHETVYQNFVYEPYRDGDGAIIGVIATTTDVTAQVEARLKIEEIVQERTAALETANTSLLKSNNELAQFAYIASHDLQEPLRKIRVFAQLLESRISGNIDTHAQNYLTKIQTASERMQTLIRDVLTYSGVENDSHLYSTVNLVKTVAEILADFELLIEQKKATVQYNGLPKIEAIPLQMSQLFGNLVSNSLKFAREGVPAQIRITSNKMNDAEKAAAGLPQTGTYHHILYADNGIGFKPEYAEKIFNIFQRLHGKSEYEGTGIGLAMCRKIAENHRGRLNAAGSSEKGAVFNLYLPEKRQDANEMQ